MQAGCRANWRLKFRNGAIAELRHAVARSQKGILLDSDESTQYRHFNEVDGALRAAEQIVPVILDLVGPVQSVVDLGGGTGAWLQAFQQAGVAKVELLDSPTVAPHLLIPRDCFRPVDLERELPPPGRFDLAVSVECAEHLSERRAEPLVRWLTSAADVVVFSAAIPGQDGKHHVNEQAPNYWQALFRRQGFLRRDVIRPRILRNATIPWWYRQNVFLFVKEGHRLANTEADFLPDDFSLIYRVVEKRHGPGVVRASKNLAKEILNAIGWW